MSGKPELIVLTDQSGRPVGQAPKLASHHGNTPLHLAFSCYVFNRLGQFLLTRRAAGKLTWPGVWTNSCCGHPAPGEPMTVAIWRRLDFELGLEPDSVMPALPDYRYRAVSAQGIVENEICPVYVASVSSEPRPNPAEVAEHRWTAWPQFISELQESPERFSPWCLEQSRLLDGLGLINTDAGQ